MSKWDEEHAEPMHDHPAEKDQLVAAMEAAGYVLDKLGKLHVFELIEESLMYEKVALVQSDNGAE